MRYCSNCGGTKLKYEENMGGVKGFILYLLAFGVLIWIPILGWIAAPVCLAYGINALTKPTTYTAICKDCGKKEEVDKEHYQRYVSK